MDPRRPDEEGTSSVLTEKVAEPDREVGFYCADEDGGGDGYRTPTSPRCRIPAVPLSCPPAPRKSKPSSSSSLRLKRRKRNSGAETEADLEDLAPAPDKKARKILQWKSVNEEAGAAVFDV